MMGRFIQFFFIVQNIYKYYIIYKCIWFLFPMLHRVVFLLWYKALRLNYFVSCIDVKSFFYWLVFLIVLLLCLCLLSNMACLNCTWYCARQLLWQGEDCVISDGDDGQSPRLPECFTCCTQNNCSDVGKTYHDYICQTER